MDVGNEGQDETGLEEGIQDLLEDFFGDVLPEEAVEEAVHVKARRLAREWEIKDTCNEMLYEGAKVSKIRTLLALMNLQSIYGWSDASITALFELLHKLLPLGNQSLEGMQRKFYLQLGLITIAYMLVQMIVYYFVGIWHSLRFAQNVVQVAIDTIRQMLPSKILRHFPLIPRMRHMFQCKGIVELMTWHANNASMDGQCCMEAHR